jgi:hypothetical protein
MRTIQRAGDSSTKVMRWIARVLGLLAGGLFVLFLICSAAKICPTLSWSSPRGMPLFIVLAMAAVGVLIAWRWELIGGAIAAVGAVALSALVYFGSGRAVFSTALMIGLPFFISGALFLACCWRTRTATVPS